MTSTTTTHAVERGLLLEISAALTDYYLTGVTHPGLRELLQRVGQILCRPAPSIEAMQQRIAALAELCDSETLQLVEARERLEHYVRVMGPLSKVDGAMLDAAPAVADAISCALDDTPLETGEADALGLTP